MSDTHPAPEEIKTSDENIKTLGITYLLKVKTDLKDHAALDYVYEQVKHLTLISITYNEAEDIYDVEYSKLE